MTTIAIDDQGFIAADGMRLWGGEIRGLDHPKIIVRVGNIYAFTGLAPMMDVMIEWHINGAAAKDVPKVDGDDGWTLVVIDNDRGEVAKFTSGCPYIERFKAPIAFGAGADIAYGAMLAGASARRAIEIVSQVTYHTGGTITEFEIAKVIAARNPQLHAAE